MNIPKTKMKNNRLILTVIVLIGVLFGTIALLLGSQYFFVSQAAEVPDASSMSLGVCYNKDDITSTDIDLASLHGVDYFLLPYSWDFSTNEKISISLLEKFHSIDQESLSVVFGWDANELGENTSTESLDTFVDTIISDASVTSYLKGVENKPILYIKNVFNIPEALDSISLTEGTASDEVPYSVTFIEELSEYFHLIAIHSGNFDTTYEYPFDEEAYLAAYHEVEDAIHLGKITSALAHFTNTGEANGWNLRDPYIYEYTKIHGNAEKNREALEDPRLSVLGIDTMVIGDTSDWINLLSSKDAPPEDVIFSMEQVLNLTAQTPGALTILPSVQSRLLTPQSFSKVLHVAIQAAKVDNEKQLLISCWNTLSSNIDGAYPYLESIASVKGIDLSIPEDTDLNTNSNAGEVTPLNSNTSDTQNLNTNVEENYNTNTTPYVVPPFRGSGGGASVVPTVEIPIPSTTQPSAPIVPETCPPKCQNIATLTDLPAEHFATNAIRYLQQRGIVSGNPDGTFKVNSPMNRAEFSKIVKNAFLIETQDSNQQIFFSDVKPTDWFYTFVRGLFQTGIIRGYGDGSFRAGNPVQRDEAAKMIALASGATEAEITESYNTWRAANPTYSFVLLPDVPVDAWFAKYAYFTISKGYITGRNIEGTQLFAPAGQIRRGEAAVLLQRVIEDKDIKYPIVETDTQEIIITFPE